MARGGPRDVTPVTFARRASGGEVRRSSSATAVRPYLAGGRRPRTAACHNGVDYELRCDMACCKSGRRSKRLRRNNPVLQRADCGTGATPEPVAQTHYRTQLANCTPSPSARRARRLRNVRYRSMTRALLLRDDCVMKESGRNACAKSIQNLVEFRLESLQLHRYATSC